jgi:phenol 2-monooxygenase
VETFQAFGFANAIVDEAYRNVEMCFWKPDDKNPENIVRVSRVPDDAHGVSEFPHIYVNQSRVLDYFLGCAEQSPGRVVPDYGIEFVDLEIDRSQAYPVAATVRYVAGPRAGEERTVRAKYIVGGDGARSQVRHAMGLKLEGDAALHAWGVLDLQNTFGLSIDKALEVSDHNPVWAAFRPWETRQVAGTPSSGLMQ